MALPSFGNHFDPPSQAANAKDDVREVAVASGGMIRG
jgi:hypothetical protein